MVNGVKRAYFGLGSNMGNKAANIRQAIARLEQTQGITVSSQSGLYRTAPWGMEDQDWFMNACIGIDTELAPEKLLDVCLETERTMGRERRQKWGPRLIDIDILCYEDATISTQTLSLPHPYLQERAFVLVPLAEIASDLIINGQTVLEALAQVDRDGIILAESAP